MEEHEEEQKEKTLKEDIAKVLVAFPESWSISKREYVRLVMPKDSSAGSNSPIWIGRKSNFSLNRTKARISYGEEDIRKLESAPDSSILQVRSSKGEFFKFEKQNGRWVRVSE